ncbi:hypothetical protein GCM10009745_64880 [Kribbella yunnanensis]|uniref:Uncharacterized protein n=1 Tax=Kribbella yunnanensis TaxID=190194 RepID=A0ABN2IMJ3_9ACTN
MSYQPPGGMAAPDYGRPPRKSRAGLFIVLMLILLIVVLGTGAWVATKVVSSIKPDKSTPPPAPITSVAPPPKLTASVKPKPTITVKTVPVKPLPITPSPAAGSPAQVAAQFVARLNANDPKGATALGCADTKQAIPALIDQFVRPPTSLTVGKTAVGSAGQIAVFAMNGTTKGATVAGTLVVEVGGRACVKAFLVRAIG